jgi:hypothetical protein
MSSVSDTPRPNATVHPRTAATTIARNATKSKSRVLRSLIWGRSWVDATQSQQSVSRAFAVLLGIALLGSLSCIPKDSSPKGFAPNNGAAGAIRVSVRKQTLTLIAPFDCLGEFWRPCFGTVYIPKRELRFVKEAPSATVAIYSCCNKQSKSHLPQADQVKWQISTRFQEHKSKPSDGSQNALSGL